MTVRSPEPRPRRPTPPAALRVDRGGRRSPVSVVVKVGGSVVAGAGLDGVLEGLARLHRRGIRCTLVHGGGPCVTRVLGRLGVETRFVDGLRVTDDASMEVTEMVLSGHVNQRIVGRLRAAGIRAAGLSGVDGGLLTAGPHPDAYRLGRVGRVVDVDPTILETLRASRFLPVVSPVCADGGGRSLNVNADGVAAALAVGLGADRLVIVSDVDGLLGEDGKRVERLSDVQAGDFVESGIARDGMVPKLEACVRALTSGLPEARLIRGGSAGGLVAAALGRGGGGTTLGGEPVAATAPLTGT